MGSHLNLFERRLKTALLNHGLLPLDGTLPDVLSGSVQLLPYPSALELLTTTTNSTPLLAPIVTTGIINKLRADALPLPPILPTQITLDLHISTAANAAPSAAPALINSALDSLLRAQIDPTDINNLSDFNDWLPSTLQHVREADASSIPLHGPVRANLCRAIRKLPLLLALRRASAPCAPPACAYPCGPSWQPCRTE